MRRLCPPPPTHTHRRTGPHSSKLVSSLSVYWTGSTPSGTSTSVGTSVGTSASSAASTRAACPCWLTPPRAFLVDLTGGGGAFNSPVTAPVTAPAPVRVPVPVTAAAVSFPSWGASAATPKSPPVASAGARTVAHAPRAASSAPSSAAADGAAGAVRSPSASPTAATLSGASAATPSVEPTAGAAASATGAAVPAALAAIGLLSPAAARFPAAGCDLRSSFTDAESLLSWRIMSLRASLERFFMDCSFSTSAFCSTSCFCSVCCFMDCNFSTLAEVAEERAAAGLMGSGFAILRGEGAANSGGSADLGCPRPAPPARPPARLPCAGLHAGCSPMPAHCTVILGSSSTGSAQSSAATACTRAANSTRADLDAASTLMFTSRPNREKCELRESIPHSFSGICLTISVLPSTP
mmetsp:Transcript_5256/g.12069  ORF Transcript_5256/g.12069 Transcript_5256/m.12069 type:complete len:410 (-) Transcript_5256:669-1898(-)